MIRFRLGAARNFRQHLNLGENEAPLNAPSLTPGRGGGQPPPPGRTPGERSSQFPSPNGCPATGGISSEPLNGARQKKDLNTPTAGLDRERGTQHPVNPARAACEGLEHPAAAAFPLGPTLPESESSVRSCPGYRDGAPRFLRRETLEKPDNVVIVAHSRPVA